MTTATATASLPTCIRPVRSYKEQAIALGAKFLNSHTVICTQPSIVRAINRVLTGSGRQWDVEMNEHPFVCRWRMRLPSESQAEFHERIVSYEDLRARELKVLREERDFS